MQENLPTQTDNFVQDEEVFDFFSEPPSEEARYIIRTIQHLRPKVLLLLGLCIFLFATTTYFFLKTSLAITPSYVKVNQIINKPFVVSLNETIGSIALNQIKISPVVPGTWSFKSGDLIGQDQLIFTPATYFKANTTYTVTPAPAKRIVFGSAHISTVQFKTQIAPSLTSSGIPSLKDNVVVAADYTFSVSLASPNKNLRNLVLRTTPSNIPMTETITGDQDYSWKPTGLLPEGSSFSVQVYDSRNDVILATKTVLIATEPSITTPVKTTEFGQSDIATITFNQPMEASSDTNIVFSLPGVGKWQSSSVYAFTPTKVAPGQTYTYTLKAGLRSQSGGVVPTDQTSSFSTVGPVTVTSSTPQGTGLSETSEQVGFTFDQAVDHASVASHFSVSSGTIGGVTWQGNSFTATVTNLGYDTTVTASLSPGIVNTGFGLPSTQAFSNSFTTAIRQLKLNIPYYHQQYAATCAAASLRMILAYYGVATSDMAIVDQMGYAPTVENKSTNPATWDDPQQMFVGSVNGNITAGTGAGPDAQPVAKAAEAFGQNASAVLGINTAWIAQQLYNNDPVVFFGAYSNTSFTTWQTPSGRIEKMNLTSHARVITGVKGNPDAPIGFWVSDPIDGASYWTAAQVQASIDLDAYQQAVVVY
jgi:uncharacterized protein YvpB